MNSRAAIVLTTMGFVVSGISSRSALSQDGSLPALTPEGADWVVRIVENSKKIAQGKDVTSPPFIDATTAESVALAAIILERISEDQPDNLALVADPDFLELLQLIQNESQAGNFPSFDATSQLITMLNAQPQVFPPPDRIVAYQANNYPYDPCNPGSANKNVLSPLLRLLGLVLPHGSGAERQTDGYVFEFKNKYFGLPDDYVQPFDAFFCNGVQTSVTECFEDAAMIGGSLSMNVGCIHNRSGTGIGDGFEAGYNLFKLSPNDPPVAAVKKMILASAAGDRPLLLFAHSQCAAIVAHAMTEALVHANDTTRASIKRNLGIITIGGFTQDASFPPGDYRQQLTEIEDPNDSVPYFAAALDWSSSRAIKSALSGLLNLLNLSKHSIDNYLCKHRVEIDAAICKYASQHGRCGDRIVCNCEDCTTSDRFEQCDDSNLSGQTCQSRGFSGGILACSANCLSFDTSGCITACAHDKCSVGPRLDAACDECVETICTLHRFCCIFSWGPLCVNSVEPLCGFVCPRCGDDVVQIDRGEQCDGSDDSACPGQCVPPGQQNACRCAVCGNNIRELDEQCDDGNNVDGDGCSSDCIAEIDLSGAWSICVTAWTGASNLTATDCELCDPQHLGCTTGPYDIPGNPTPWCFSGYVDVTQSGSSLSHSRTATCWWTSNDICEDTLTGSVSGTSVSFLFDRRIVNVFSADPINNYERQTYNINATVTSPTQLGGLADPFLLEFHLAGPCRTIDIVGTHAPGTVQITITP